MFPPRTLVVVRVSLRGGVFRGMVGGPDGGAVVEKRDQEVVLGTSPLELQNLHLNIKELSKLSGPALVHQCLIII